MLPRAMLQGHAWFSLQSLTEYSLASLILPEPCSGAFFSHQPIFLPGFGASVCPLLPRRPRHTQSREPWPDRRCPLSILSGFRNLGTQSAMLLRTRLPGRPQSAYAKPGFSSSDLALRLWCSGSGRLRVQVLLFLSPDNRIDSPGPSHLVKCKNASAPLI